jgi:hypothetical protein
MFRNSYPSHGGDHKTFEVMTSTLPIGTLGLVESLLVATNRLSRKFFTALQQVYILTDASK